MDDQPMDEELISGEEERDEERPSLASQKQLRYIGMMLTYKKKEKEVIYKFFGVDTMKKLTKNQAKKVIDQLQKYPDVIKPKFLQP